MFLVDSSIWIDHLHRSEPQLVDLLERGRVFVHEAVVAEVALGRVANRGATLDLLDRLPHAIVASAPEVRALIERVPLVGGGIGYVDAQLIAAGLITPDVTGLWTRGRRLAAIAAQLGLQTAPGA